MLVCEQREYCDFFINLLCIESSHIFVYIMEYGSYKGCGLHAAVNSRSQHITSLEYQVTLHKLND